MKNTLFLLFSLLFFTSCTNYSLTKDTDPNKTTNFSYLTKTLLQPLCKDIYPNKALYVTDFVNESNLQNRSQLGFLLSNNLKVNILNRNCTKSNVIKSFELGDNIKIGGDGSKIFTRKLSDLGMKNIDKNNQILVGTYLFTKKQFIIYLKLINFNTGNIISSNYITAPLTFEIQELEGIDTNTDPVIYRPMTL
ncbi:MAG TPA: hypothetical protein EYG73_12165 [Arcobacter sp.]|nr:hypothetical protein [Arcobacter sp.]